MEQAQENKDNVERRLLEILENVNKNRPFLTAKYLEEVDDALQHIIAENPNIPSLLFHYNEFRIAHANKLPRTRPQILTSGLLFVGLYPHVHLYPLFEVADVVCLNTNKDRQPCYSAIPCQPIDFFSEILKRLPEGFTPDFYWDNQIESRHFIPWGIEFAPFPIIASVCHMYYHKSIEHVCELFDRVIPISKFHAGILKKKYPEKIIDMPFGLNWGSMEQYISPQWEKTVDVCLTFGESDYPSYSNKRNRIVELTKQFKEKYGDRFVIEIISKLPRTEYANLLKKSRIAINVTGIHGPYNYRTVESMCAGSMVFQYEWEGEFFENKFSELFIEGVHGVSFNFDNFESKLLYYLENPDKVEKIARAGRSYLIENYNYQALYKDLIKLAKDTEVILPRSIKRNFYHVDMIYYYQNSCLVDFLNYGVLNSNREINWIKTNNLMLYANEKNLGYPLIASRNVSPWSLCCNYYYRVLRITPAEFLWIIEWNFLLLALEKGVAEKPDVEKLIVLLEKEEAVPFDEDGVIFKYFVTSKKYPNYYMKSSLDAKGVKEFVSLNMELIKVNDNPKARALLHQRYALKAAKYFLTFF
jgi:glycosyltransferase involved in cell wall biosynthesis